MKTVDEVNKGLQGEAPALIQTFESKGFKIFMDWVGYMEECLRENVVQATTHDEWRDAKAQWEAYRRMKELPRLLMSKVKALDGQPLPPDAPGL